MLGKMMLLTAVLAVALAGPGCDKPEESKAAPEETGRGEAPPAATPAVKAPDFALADHTGKTVRLADHAGKIVVLEWTNPQCPYVVRHYAAGTMARLAAKYAPKGVVWLAVHSSHFATQQANGKWVRSQQLPYPVLDDHTGDVSRAYGAKRTPHMFVLDRTGVIAYRGAIDSDIRGGASDVVNYVEEALEDLLAGRAVTIANTKPYGCTVKLK